ncbi:RING-type E3 ubiquitin transferase [Salvia divinorum]|uniref:RING-type E3 ubiquitin transferase n=1 Tax=Salvia divinorum TaxID=28513 RepID=A0ABD1HQ56_SALDI
MSDEGEKTCPLCAEEMDLTDQQLKPCKCGYEICVWCWHHIMDMAEKDETEGRCPACRTAYNKEKIVGTTAKCERLVSEMSVEKKVKSQKGKSKASEGRKQLGSVRVIQRNLVYVVGLPLNFADEDLLQRREYFGQYGKVLKVSISRTATGAIQQFANSTCSVYITYSKEEEAVRCIQLVHGFALDGKPLRACFGTTKYCHAWLRNMPCTNPDCLYLHDIGSQDDSFTKDEVISEHTRSRIQQVTSSSISTQRRSGNVLPPPGDDYSNNNSSTSSVKPMAKTATNTNNSVMSTRNSPPSSSSGISAALPAGVSWGIRPSGNQPLLTSTSSSSGPPNQKTDMSNGPAAFSKSPPSQVSSLQNGTGKKRVPNEGSTISLEKSKTETSGPVKKEANTDGSIVSDTSSTPAYITNVPLSSQLHSPPKTRSLLNISNIVDSSPSSNGLVSDKDPMDYIDNNMENVCSDVLSLSIQENQHSKNNNVEQFRESSVCETSGEVKNTTDVVHIASVQSDSRLGMPDEVTKIDLPELDNDLLSFHIQRIMDPEIASSRTPNFSDALNLNHSDFISPAFDNANGLTGFGFNSQAVHKSANLMVSASNSPSVYLENTFNNGAEYSALSLRKEKMPQFARYETEVDSGVSAIDTGESSIISNILSLDFDSWDESVSSPQNLAKLIGETDRRQGSFGAPGSWKTQNSSQSRFSFAREEEAMSRLPEQSIDYHEQALKQHLFGHNFSGSNRFHAEKFVSTNGLPVSSGTEQDYFANNVSQFSSNKLPISRPHVSAPPGFSAPSRAAAPPGFTSHVQAGQFFESHSGNHALEAASFLRNQYQTPPSGDSYSNGDIEFMDPAILAVGKGTLASGINNMGLDIRSNFSPQFNTYDEARFQSILQRSFPPHHNQRFSDLGNNLSTLGDTYGIPSRVVEQTLTNNHSPFSQFNLQQYRNGVTSNGQWDGWNESQSVNKLSMDELLRAERLELSSKLYGGYEESKMRMPGSGNIYNGAYGI